MSILSVHNIKELLAVADLQGFANNGKRLYIKNSRQSFRDYLSKNNIVNYFTADDETMINRLTKGGVQAATPGKKLDIMELAMIERYNKEERIGKSRKRFICELEQVCCILCGLHLTKTEGGPNRAYYIMGLTFTQIIKMLHDYNKYMLFKSNLYLYNLLIEMIDADLLVFNGLGPWQETYDFSNHGLEFLFYHGCKRKKYP